MTQQDDATHHGHMDRGWAWIIVAAVFGSNILCVGFFRAYSVFFVEIVDTYQTTSSVASLIFGAQNAVFCVSALLVHNVLLEVVTVRTSAVIGGFLMATGMAMASLASSLPVLIFFISGLVGMGNALTYGPGLVLLGQYFSKRRALAFALATTGSSVGSMTMPLLATSLLQLYGLRGAWLLYGAITLHLCVFTSLYRPILQANASILSTPCVNEKDPGDVSTDEESGSDEVLINNNNTDGALGSEKVMLSLELFAPEHETNDLRTGVKKDFKSLGERPVSGSCDDVPVSRQQNDLNEKQYSLSGRFLPRLLADDNAVKAFSSTGDVHQLRITQDHPADLSDSADVDKLLLHRRSLTVGDLRHSADQRLHGSKGSVRSLSSVFQRKLKNVAMHASHPHLMIQSPSYACLPRGDDPASSGSSEDEVTLKDTKDAKSTKSCKGYFAKFACDADLLRNPVFWLIQVYVCVGVAGSSGGGAYLPSLCRERGLNPSETAMVLTTWGGVNLVGRLLVGLVADRRWLRPARISALAFLGIGTLFQLLRFFPRDSLRAMLSVGVLYGLFEAAYFTMLPVIIIDFLSLKHFSRTFGFAQLSQGAFGSVMYPVLGALRDETGNYLTTYHALGACALLAAVLLLLEPAVRAMRKISSRENVV